MRKLWSNEAWEDYLYWQNNDKKTFRKINNLIKDIECSLFDGIGKPEPLKYKYQGCWSRRIDECNRLIYFVKKDDIEILICRSHYDD